ncbi:MAG: hypothetical protein F7B20_05890 [Aeropyrum sp.]|nr:hypothetical protein [Aeropyrum sp.]
MITSSLICECGHGRAVIKDYTKRLFKWVVTIPYSPVYRYIYSSVGRLENELEWYNVLKDRFSIPRFLAYCTKPKARLLREYVDGSPLANTEAPKAWSLAGARLASLHEELGVALGDPNPGNFIYDGEDLWLVDLEQASAFTSERAAWDILVFASTALVLSSLNRYNLVQAALRAYRESLSDEMWSSIKRALMVWRIMVLNPLLAIPVYNIRLMRFLASL